MRFLRNIARGRRPRDFSCLYGPPDADDPLWRLCAAFITLCHRRRMHRAPAIAHSRSHTLAYVAFAPKAKFTMLNCATASVKRASQARDLYQAGLLFLISDLPPARLLNIHTEGMCSVCVAKRIMGLLPGEKDCCYFEAEWCTVKFWRDIVVLFCF